ncbi:MAG: response regulator [Deltaproteobacteria bacterium]|nr:response regulator [Deltaproteobacteria bacterium]
MEESYRPARILLVEDSEGDIYIFRRALREAKFLNEIQAIQDGEQAWEHLRSLPPAERPDVIFLDINLPRLTGLELLKRMHADEGLSQIPVIMLTISQEEEDIVQAYDYGAFSFISKTVQPENLLDIISNLDRLYVQVVARETA